MNRLKNIFTILFYSLTLVSCEQAKTKQQPDKTTSQNQIEKVEDLEVEYTACGFACPNWTRTENNKSNDANKNYLSLHFYIEATDKSLELPIYFDPLRHKLKLTGQFYEREDYTQGIVKMVEPITKARVFQYTKIEVVDNPRFKPNSKIETLTLNYNVISCTCAQWSETRFSGVSDNKVYYWLEPANQKLTNADTLFNGVDLPVIIKVTGQIVCKNGFPKENLTKVGQDEAGNVFKYTKIEVIKNGSIKNGR